MLNLPQTTLEKVKKILVRQQAQVEQELKTIEKDDPVLAEALAETIEPGTESFEADAHSRFVAIKNDLVDLLKKTTSSLTKINKGTYGICEKCAEPIESSRLEALPTATTCLSCSKKAIN